MDRRAENWTFTSKNEEEFYQELLTMANHSQWIPGVPTTELRCNSVIPLERELHAQRLQKAYPTGMLTATAEDIFNVSQQEATGLLLKFPTGELAMRGTAIGGIHNAAKLYGSAFSRMPVETTANILNEGLTFARGTSLLLVRDGWISAIHSAHYGCMPIHSLFQCLKQGMKAKFDTPQFEGGINQHGLTECMWSLPEAQQDLQSIYLDALDAAGGRNSVHTLRFMPVVSFTSSDTSTSSACAIPGFLKPGSHSIIRFCDGVQVRHHSSDGGTDCMEKFEKGVGELYSQFENMAATISAMGGIFVRNPENVLIGLSNSLGIPKIYADKAREQLARLSVNVGRMSFHDIYLFMVDVPSYAKSAGASRYVVTNLCEQIAKIPKISAADIDKLDVGGVVAWGTK